MDIADLRIETARLVLRPPQVGDFDRFAELLADGHIHVYGAMRGRALAGINGNSQARIFCHQLGAELVSIAGQYKIAEDLRRIPAWDGPVQIYLEDEHMRIEAL